MAEITEAEALTVLPLSAMKTELRIPATESSHDTLLSQQIHNAANFAAQSSGRALADLISGQTPAIALGGLTLERYS